MSSETIIWSDPVAHRHYSPRGKAIARVCSLDAFRPLHLAMLLLTGLLFLAGCETRPLEEEPPPAAEEQAEEAPVDEPPAALGEDPFLLEGQDLLALGAARPGTQIAVLVPLSGRLAGTGQALLNAAQIALFDLRDANVTLMPLDTAGTPEGARDAALKAVADGADIIIGPLLSNNVTAIAPVTRAAGVSVLSFSNNPAVAQQDIYVIGFSPNEQVKAIVDYALAEGLTRFAALAPSGAYGELVVRALQEALADQPAELSRIRFVDQAALDYSEEIIVMSDYEARKRALATEIRELEAIGDDASRAALRRLETLDTLGDPEFDAILLPMTNDTSLRTASAQLAFYDVDQPAVRVLGVQLWEEFQRLEGEPTLVGSWYPAPDATELDRFRARYQQLYGNPAPRIASLGYDAVALSVLLAGNTAAPVYNAGVLTNPMGFVGIDGLFRLQPDGTAERSYAIREIRPEGTVVIKPAAVDFPAAAIN